MTKFCLAVVVGVLVAHGAFPLAWPLVGVCLLLLLPLRSLTPDRGQVLLGGFVLGLAVTATAIDDYLRARLPAATEGRVVSVVGVVDSLPQRGPAGLRLTLHIVDGPLSGRRLRLDWADPRQRPGGGDRWWLRVRLAPVDSRRNPGSTDQDRALVARRIHGFGRVVESERARRLVAGSGVHGVRERMSQRVRLRLGDTGAGALAVALLVGDRRYLDAGQWRRLIATGTNHLVAISGLHVGLAAASAWWVCATVWRWLALGQGRIPAQLLAAPPALLVATGYAAMAGFSAPTQRALLMLAVVLGLRCLRRPASSPAALALAAAAMVLFEPFAPLQAGAWLSFLAVACLLAAFAGRSPGVGLPLHPIAVWWRAQSSLFVGLAPATLGGFGQLSLVSPLANAFAVPLVSAYVVPLLLLSVPGDWLSPVLASGLTGWAGWWLDRLETGLEWLARTGLLLQPQAAVPAVVAVPALILSLGWIRGLGRRLLLPLLPALVLCLTGLRAPPPGAGQWRITLLDAGGAPVSLVETRDQRFLIDAGPPAFASARDRAAAATGAAPVDAWIVTRVGRGHHADGAGTPAPAPESTGLRLQGCQPEHVWEGASVRVAVLALATAGHCAVLIETPGGRILFATGVERQSDRARLAGVLDAPGPPLLAVVVDTPGQVPDPPGRLMLVAGRVSAGLRGEPAPGTSILSTACQGAIELRSSGTLRVWRGPVWWQRPVGCESESRRAVGRVGFD